MGEFIQSGIKTDEIRGLVLKTIRLRGNMISNQNKLFMLLKIMPEYECSSLWISNDGHFFLHLEIFDAPFDNQLKHFIKDWAQRFDATLNQEYPPDSGFSDMLEQDAFEEDGIKIWLEILNNYTHIYNNVHYWSYAKKRLFLDVETYIRDSNLLL